MTVSFLELFFLSFSLIALAHAVLAAWTGLLYRNRSVGRLTGDELRVKQGNATIEHRLNLLAKTFFSSIFTYQIYLLALLASTVIYFVTPLL